jgi:hypothetical protein
MVAFLEPPLLCTQHRGLDQDGDSSDEQIHVVFL